MQWILLQKKFIMTIQVFIRTLSGKHVTADVDEHDTIGNLKSRIQDYEGIPTEQQRLLYCGRQLKDGNTLADHNVTTDSTLQLLLRLVGGKGGFGSLLRSEGKRNVVDNFDSCRDLQGKRIRQKTAEDKLEQWNAQSRERELEKIALNHIKDQQRAAKRQQQEEVDVEAVREAQRDVFKGVSEAVNSALKKKRLDINTSTTIATHRNNNNNNKQTSSEGVKEKDNNKEKKKKRKIIDPLDALDEDDEEVDDNSDLDDELLLGF